MIPRGKKPIEWWEEEAQKIAGRTCPKCHAPTEGVYVTPNEYGECGVIEHCLICGWSHLVLAGKNHRIESQKERPRAALKTVGDKSVSKNGRLTTWPSRLVGAPLRERTLRERKNKGGKTHHGASLLLTRGDD